MRIANIVQASFREAAGALVMGTSAASLARARERAFVKALTARLESSLGGDNLRVIGALGRRSQPADAKDALPFDISVCRVDRGSTAGRQPQDFDFISEALWQIELDFSRDWRGALRAINRLNSGAAAGKVLIAAELGSRTKGYLDTLATPFASGSGERYLALIPHPAEWDDSDAETQTWRLQGGQWIAAADADA